MGLFKRKTDEQIIAEGRKLYIQGKLADAAMKLLKVAAKGNPEACYWEGRVLLEQAVQDQYPKFREQGRSFLEKAVRDGHREASALLAKEFGVPDVFAKEKSVPDTQMKAKAEAEARARAEAEAKARAEAEAKARAEAEAKANEAPKSDEIQNLMNTLDVLFAAKLAEVECLEKGEELGSDSVNAAVAQATREAEERVTAQQKSPEELYRMGMQYYGEGDDYDTPEDAETAEKYFLPAAEQGHAAAQHKLFMLYCWGNLHENDTEGIKWLRRSAAQGYPAALFHLHEVYMNGFGVPVNEEKALSLLKQAAAGGYKEAQYQLAEHYYRENMYDQTNHQRDALKWYMAAAEQGHEMALMDLSQLYNRCSDPELQDELTQWLLKHAPADDLYDLACEKFRSAASPGKIPDAKALQQGIAFMTTAAEGGNSLAMLDLAQRYHKGDCVPADIHKAIKWYTELAEQDDDYAMLCLARIYIDGDGVPENMPEACKWFTKLAEQGNPAIQAYLGCLYCSDTSNPDGNQLAYKWFCAAAEQNNPYAMYMLAHMHNEGIGIPQNYKEAFRLYQTLLDLVERQLLPSEGEPNVLHLPDVGAGFESFSDSRKLENLENLYIDASFDFGVMHYYGRGTPVNKQEAFHRFQTVASYGDPRAQCNLGFMYLNGEAVDKNAEKAYKMFLAAAQQGYDDALDIISEAAADGEAEALYALGILYLNGTGVPEDKHKAAELFKAAIEKGCRKAAYDLGIMQYHGDGVPKDKKAAFRNFTKASNAKHPGALYFLGVMFANGEGYDAALNPIPKHMQNAFLHFFTAARRGHADAQFMLGLLYYSGDGVQEDKEAALKWFLAAAEQGHVDAQYNTGIMYYNGEGTPENSEEAYRWLSEAADNGHDEAASVLTDFSDLDFDSM